MSKELSSKKCQACSGDMPAMAEDETRKYLDKVGGLGVCRWDQKDKKRL